MSIAGHEHRGPDNGVEADDLLADKVHIGGPVFVEIVVSVVLEAERGHVVEQRVDPDVDNVAGVKIDRHAPREAGTGDAEILQTGVDEVVDHFVDAGLRLEEIRLGQELAHAVCVLGEAEEIRLLLRVVHLAAAVGAFAVLELALGPEALAGGAVFALVGALIDVAVFIHLLEDLLNGGDVVIVGRADEAVVRDVHQLPQVEHALGAGDDVVDELLRRDAGGLRLFLDLLAVLVRAGQEHHIAALKALIARHRVGRHGAVAVADVQLRRGVVDRRRDIKRFLALFTHVVSSFPAAAE